ncbi:IclR family transcriptional regulator [Halomonas sp. Bachu 37]|uniref:IclR family transcriptional regulator n=1 Tax=Halomonas kashgarensis TaxID=3084920 RepID=UPI00321628BB
METPERHMKRVPAVTRAIAILRYLGKRKEPLGVNQLARDLELIPSTCLHILRTLVEEELVAFDPETKLYSLDAGILTLAHNVMRQNSFGDIVQPALNQLSERYGVTAIGVRVSGMRHMVVVAVSHMELPFRLHISVGSRFPALISATGRCFAAFGSHNWDDLSARFQSLKWERAPSLEEWRHEVERTRETGYAIDNGNYIRGITIVSVPVLDSRDEMSHAVVVVGVAEQVKDDGMKKMIEEMRDIAGNISWKLGGKGEIPSLSSERKTAEA